MLTDNEIEPVVSRFFGDALQQGYTYEDSAVLLLSIIGFAGRETLLEAVSAATMYVAVNPVREAR
jgi:hypothetical protein